MLLDKLLMRSKSPVKLPGPDYVWNRRKCIEKFPRVQISTVSTTTPFGRRELRWLRSCEHCESESGQNYDKLLRFPPELLSQSNERSCGSCLGVEMTVTLRPRWFNKHYDHFMDCFQCQQFKRKLQRKTTMQQAKNNAMEWLQMILNVDVCTTTSDKWLQYTQL